MQPPMLFPRAWAYISQEALLAFRATSHAEFASKMDPLVIDVQPIGLRVDFHELRLNLFRRIVVARRKPQLMGDAEYMRIDSDALRVSKRLAHNHICRFAPHSRKLLQIGHSTRHFATKFGKHRLRTRLQVLRFTAEKPERMNNRLYVFNARRRHGFRCTEASK